MRAIKRIAAILVVCFFAISTAGFAADKGNFKTTPKSNNGKKWRIGYYEGGEYIAYQQFLEEAIKGLMKLGWVENTKVPTWKGEQTKDLWNWLSSGVKSDYIEFVKDFHYTANWDEKLREKTAAAVIKRVNKKKDIDMIIAMGTWAGQDLANDKHSVPTIVLSASDAVGAGIVKSIEDSGRDHVFSRVDPRRYERQVRTFHDIIGFKKLGVVYENTVSGRSYAAIDKVEKVAKERNFEIERCYAASDIADEEQRDKKYVDCFRELARKADAIYVTVHGGVNARNMSNLVHIATSHRSPTFSQAGSTEVKWGFLTSLSQASYKYVGEFNAGAISKVFNGAKPRQLEQVFEAPPQIAINLKTAVSIGYDPPVDVLAAADEIYQDIEIPPSE